jgi:hypothetical protein
LGGFHPLSQSGSKIEEKAQGTKIEKDACYFSFFQTSNAGYFIFIIPLPNGLSTAHREKTGKKPDKNEDFLRRKMMKIQIFQSNLKQNKGYVIIRTVSVYYL